MMKLLNLSLLTSLPIGTFAASSSSSLFFNFPNGPNQVTASLSQVDIRRALAERLGVSRYHSLGDDANLPQLDKVEGGSKGSLWLDEYDRKGSVVIAVGGVADPKSILSDEKPSIQLKDSPSSSAFTELLTNLRTQKEQITGHKGVEAYSNPLGSFVYVISPTGSSDVVLRSSSTNDFKEFEKLAGSDVAAAFDQDVPSDMNFVQEVVVLSKLLDEEEMGKVVAERSTVVAHLISWESVYKNWGVNSKQYKAASSLLSTVVRKFANTDPKYPTTLGFLTPSTRNAKRDFVGNAVEFQKRRKEKEIPIGQPSKPTDSVVATKTGGNTAPTDANPPPLQKYAACFTTHDACQSITSNCSGRGECIESKTQKYCWSCKCKPTVKFLDQEGKRRSKTYWGGSACQKKDISVPFWLLFTFTIAIVSIMYFAVGALMEMGAEELPGVLSAGVSGVKKN